MYIHNTSLNLDVYSPFILIILTIEVPVRHTVTKWAGKYWLNLYELFSLLIEITIGLYYTIAVASAAFDDRGNVRYAFLGSTYVFISCLSISLCFLLYDLAFASGPRFLKPFHILGLKSFNAYPSPQSLFFGRHLFAMRYRHVEHGPPLILERSSYHRNEGSPIRILRGAIAGTMLLFFGLVLMFALVVQPFENLGTSLEKEFRISTKTLQNHGLFTDTSWKINIQNRYLSDGGLQNATRVTYSPSLVQSVGNCSDFNATARGISFHCPIATFLSEEEMSSGGRDPYSLPRDPEVFVRFNFSMMPEIQNLSYSDPLSHFATKIAIGLGEADEDLANSTSFVSLLPRSNLIGAVSMKFVQRLISSRFAVLGWPKHSPPTPVVFVETLFPDPKSPADVSDSHEISTLRLFPVRRDVAWRLIQDYNEDSVLSGFALLGGVWTFLNGIFSILFGCTLLLMLFGIKPLSIYGLAHLITGNKTSLAEGSTMTADEQRHFLAQLREHLMDVGDLEETSSKAFPTDIESNNPCRQGSSETERSSISYISVRESEDGHRPSSVSSTDKTLEVEQDQYEVTR
ncbi:hypothetical protein AN958_01095 [Leucoagaricus sp. SymC.cos]|nr:hypothetical protein AN958_01095 [Leucoagaricus sp. SymC.cos]